MRKMNSIKFYPAFKMQQKHTGIYSNYWKLYTEQQRGAVEK